MGLWARGRWGLRQRRSEGEGAFWGKVCGLKGIKGVFMFDGIHVIEQAPDLGGQEEMGVAGSVPGTQTADYCFEQALLLIAR